MSEFDLVVRGWLLKILPYIGGTVILLILWKRRKAWMPQMSAWFFNRFLKRLHAKVQNEKDELFSSLASEKTLSSPFTILEIGAGSGLNFKHYPDTSNVICLDPNPNHGRYLEENRAILNPRLRQVEYMRGYAESMPQIPDASVDAVTCTLVLCSVRDPQAVFSEVKRVLKPGGKFYFLEHVASERGTPSRIFQNTVNPVWLFFSDGCHLQRETMNLIKAAGFTSVTGRGFTLRVGFCLSIPGLLGVAVN